MLRHIKVVAFTDIKLLLTASRFSLFSICMIYNYMFNIMYDGHLY